MICQSAVADPFRIGCLKLNRVCTPGKGCVWWGNPGQALNVDLTKKSDIADGELYEGKLETSIDDQKFTISVLQKRVINKGPINYINLEVPISNDIVISSEGLSYSHAKYVNKAKNEGVTIRCSTGI